MSKWYEDQRCNNDVVVGGQICLVRNVAGFPFEEKMSFEEQDRLLDNVCTAVRSQEDRLGIYFYMHDLFDVGDEDRAALIDGLKVPSLLMGRSKHAGLLISSDESVSILVNGTEHICIQVSCPGRNIQSAYETASRIDDAINAHLPYDFSRKYGYLTASPLFTWTGMTASYLLHIPFARRKEKSRNYSKEFSKEGFSIYGLFSGSAQAPGGIYRLRNTRTLGLSESEIISALENLTNKVFRQEKRDWEEISAEKLDREIDKMYRSYALLRYARILGYEETLKYLSYMRSAYQYGIWHDDKLPDLFAMMIGSQDPVLKMEQLGGMKTEVHRAAYIRSRLKEIGER